LNIKILSEKYSKSIEIAAIGSKMGMTPEKLKVIMKIAMR